MIDSSRKLIWEVSEMEYGREHPTAFLFLVLVATFSSWAHTLDGKLNTGLQLEGNRCFLPVHSAVSFLPSFHVYIVHELADPLHLTLYLEKL